MDIIGRSYMFITSKSLTVKMKTPKSFLLTMVTKTGRAWRVVITPYTVSLDIQIVQKYVQAMPIRTKTNFSISHCIKSKV